jgi:hypothetical protein
MIFIKGGKEKAEWLRQSGSAIAHAAISSLSEYYI